MRLTLSRSPPKINLPLPNTYQPRESEGMGFWDGLKLGCFIGAIYSMLRHPWGCLGCGCLVVVPIVLFAVGFYLAYPTFTIIALVVIVVLIIVSKANSSSR